MPKSLSVYSQINKLREQYYKIVTGKQALLKLINEAEVVEQVYNSNAIENSTLSLEETEKILLQIDLDRFISERVLSSDGCCGYKSHDVFRKNLFRNHSNPRQIKMSKLRRLSVY